MRKSLKRFAINTIYTPTEFNNALNELSTKKQKLYMQNFII